MTDEYRIIHIFKPFVLGKCRCGCKTDITLRTVRRGFLKRFEKGHDLRGSSHHNYKEYEIEHEGYILVWKPGHPNAQANGYIQKHRLVMSEHLDRPLEKEETVHHIDHNPRNNDISNLQLLESHSKHLKEMHKRDLSGRICLLCSKTTTYISSKGHPHWFKYKDGYICSICRDNRRYKLKTGKIKDYE